MKKTIAIDIDGVLAKHNEALVEYYNDKYGTSHTLDDYFSEHWSEVWQTSPQETEQRALAFQASGAHAGLQPMSDAQAALIQLTQDYRLVIVTLRPKMNVDITHDWLERYYPNIFHEVRFVHAWDDVDAPSKAEVCQEIGAELLIDDSIKHCRIAADAGIDSILFGNYPWNQTDQPLSAKITRVCGWAEVLEYFDARKA